mgnify:CR=1 FL=1
MPIPSESDIAALLNDLMAVQGELLALLARKQSLIREKDTAGLAELPAQEEALIKRLAECHARREQFLKDAQADGVAANSILSLAGQLPEGRQSRLYATVKDAQTHSRLLYHQSLANLLIVQRSLIHLSQMIEIIATGGRSRPTYSREGKSVESGSLVDHAA